MGSDENVAPAVSDEHNDLKGIITGIGPTYAEALHKIGIRCVEDLAKCEPNELLKSLRPLREQGSFKSLPKMDDVKGWIGQARKRVQRANTEHTLSEEEAEAAKKPQQTPIKNEWEEHAAFSVFFEYEIDEDGERVWQTRVSDDKDHKKLEGIDIAGMVNWVLERANLPVEAKPIPTEAEAAAPSAPVTPYDVQIDILDADVNQSSVAPGKRLVAEARFKISGLEAETLMKKEIPFEILFHTVNRESGAADLVASEQGQLEPQKRKYLGKQEFPIPVLGHYELETIILLLPPGEIMAFRLRDPPFRVVPH